MRSVKILHASVVSTSYPKRRVRPGDIFSTTADSCMFFSISGEELLEVIAEGLQCDDLCAFFIFIFYTPH